MNIQITGIENISKMLEKINIEENGDKVLEKVADKILEQVRMRTPVRTGNLRKGWRMKKLNQNEYIIHNNVKYALI